MALDDYQRADDLDRYWDAILRGETPARPPGIDEIAATVIARLGEPAESLHLADAQQRVRQQVVESTTAARVTGRFPAASPVSAREIKVRKPRSKLAWLAHPILRYAAAAMLILGIVLGIDSIRSGHGPGGNHGGAPVIFAPATPSPEASPDTTLFTITLPADMVPHTTERITGLARARFLPGSHSVWRPYCCNGAVIQYQLSGTLQVTGTAEFQVVRADGTIDRIPASTEATVNTGDALVTLNQIGLTTVNSGDTDAEILEWTLLDSPGDKFAGRSGQAGLFGITHVVASDGRRNMIDLPGGAIVRLQRMDLAPGEPIYRVDGVVQLAVTFDPVTEPIIYAGDGSYIKASNSNGTPTTSVYLLTLMPADDSSPPGANTPKA